ncbi:FkbM family methyltransferase [Pararhodospirillum photometricum]|uniref:Methyltransferase FkbM domain-containing protein n=1 Tax=Pararhodospirillum photometricum DSM 122 TaxID=1150469 RepID=H6SR49_PARPM|nr:FkbM family methyltransferase [Pararhodospirillum photometricum]CCG09771.1 Putative uncharacterized protein [Pararhodospirillum photometricum DSM 122]
MKQTPAHAVANAEILSLVPSTARCVVEVGCMLGAMAREVRKAAPKTRFVGIDIDPDYAAQAAAFCTETHAGDIETFTPAQWEALFPSDCWIFGDCLEHLRDPWRVLRRVRRRIDPDGCLLVCVPNAQHWSVQWRLASGQFRYEDQGLMDRTHLRWFTRITMLEMFAATGWQVEQGLTRLLPAIAQQDAILQALRGLAVAGGFDPEGAVSDALPFQYVFKCVPGPVPEGREDGENPAAETMSRPASTPVPRSSAKAERVALYQIAYAKETVIEPGYARLDNTDNPRPDWREYWPIRRFLLEETLDEMTFYGFFSPKFGTKTLLSHDQVVAFIDAQAAQADVILFSPQPDMGAMFLNVFEQAEVFDPGLMEAYQSFLNQRGVDVPLSSLVMDARHVVFSNFFVARPAFWREWLAFNEALFAVCEGPETPLRTALCQPTTYPGEVERKVFLQERTASLLLTMDPSWRVAVHDPFGKAWSMSRFREHPMDAAISDSLKRAYRDTAFPQYLEAFSTVRERFRQAGPQEDAGEERGRRYRHVLVACARWEAPYIREWLSYHRALGFDHVYLCCNDDDPSALVTEISLSPTLVDFVTVRHFPERGQQRAMYLSMMDLVSQRADWVMFLDIDEFLVLRGVNNLGDFLARFPETVDTVYFNWLMFGNSGFVSRPAGSVLEQYTWRAQGVDPHTKHISRVSRLDVEALRQTQSAFWHGLPNPDFALLSRVNVLGTDWGGYWDRFPEHAQSEVDDSALAESLIATATVHHYVMKSEEDFLIRVRRSVEGQFGGQLKWLETFQQGGHTAYLASLRQVEDPYLQDFARSHPLEVSQKGPTTAVMAETSSWQAPLHLESSSGRVTHGTHGSGGRYVERGEHLLIEWDDWPAEVFQRDGEVYRKLETLGAGPNTLSLEQPAFARLEASRAPLASVCWEVSEGTWVHVRPGTSDLPVVTSVFWAHSYDLGHDLGEVRTVVDLGANIGASALYFAQRYPKATLVAVEPEESNFLLLQKNLLGLPRVFPLRAAIWSHDTECEVDVEEQGQARAPWAFRSRAVGEGGARVAAWSMPTLLRHYEMTTVDLLKIDVEGAEVELFCGSLAWLEQVRWVVIETHERFRPGAEEAVTRALAPTHQEHASVAGNRVFSRRDTYQDL